MIRHIRNILLAISIFSAPVFAQGAMGELKGTISDEMGDPMPFVNITLMKDGFQFRGMSTDMNGTYWMKAVPAGVYKIVISALGYHTVERPVAIESGGNITFFNYKMVPSSQEIPEFTFSENVLDIPLIKKDETMVRTTIRREDLLKLPTRDVLSAATTVGGVFSRDGEVGNFRGARQAATVFIDGVRIRGGSGNLPQQSVEETQVILGGVPAAFGDATGGLILVTTRGISNKYFGALEGRTSKFLDQWDDALFSGVFGGPLAFKKDTTKDGKRPVLGFLTAVEGRYAGDPSPVANGIWRVRPDVRERIINDPIRLAETGSGSRLNSEYLRMNDFERVPTRINVASQSLNWQGKLDYSISPRTTVAVGGFVNLGQNRGGRDGGTHSFSLFNWENNRQVQNFTWNIWGRITQRFEDTSRNAKGLNNALLSLQVDYLNGNSTVQDPRHGTNFFNYGHVGRFTPRRTAVYPTFGFDAASNTSGWLFGGFQDTLIDFEPGTLNPLAAAITSQYYTLFDSPRGFYDEFPSIQNGGGLLNGQSPRSVYDLWSHVGTPFNSYERSDNNQFRVVGQGSAVIKNHDIQIGFEFEQRTDNFYSISPVPLWRIAWLQTNSHLGQIDTSRPELVFDQNGMFADTINYPFLYREDELRTQQTGYKFGVGQSFFDWNMRQRLGLAVDGLDFIDVDTYDPSFFDITMFSADELLNQGSSLVNYYGYDVYGRKLGGNVSFEDFFTARDEYGNFSRPIAPFQPIYLAGYIQDKFSFKDIIFNVGVRVDRFDANQQVLKDRYSLYETRTRAEVDNLGGNAVSHPGNIGNNYVVYVNDRENPTEVVGYRNGSVWYNNLGEVINDPALLRTSTGRVQPLMVNPSDDIQSTGFNPSGSFVDYEPQVNVMPRISFSFPISDDVGFTAYYDVLTQRPSAAVRLNPLDYFFWDNAAYNTRGRFFNNPSLRPERTTDFSLGFRQKLTPVSALRISTFYRELRDMIALIQINEAFPRTYGSWDNIDFGTVKGVTFEYELRKSRSFSLTATYTLQFADGTGSDNVSQLNLVNSGQPNLRTTVPTNFDRRHLFTAFAIYRMGSDRDSTYKGPRSLKWLLENFGASATLRGGSGVPFTRQNNVTGTQLGGGFGQPSLDGSINGARLPWEFNIDLMVDKDIDIVWGKKKSGDGPDTRKKSTLNIYMQILNLFDIQNIIAVYGATGNPNDDGFLDAPEFQPYIIGQIDQQAFRDYYMMRVDDPRNLSLPRRIRAGVILNF
jgi:hypothetical protein